jgi:hypothetical protein
MRTGPRSASKWSGPRGPRLESRQSLRDRWQGFRAGFQRQTLSAFPRPHHRRLVLTPVVAIANAPRPRNGGLSRAGETSSVDRVGARHFTTAVQNDKARKVLRKLRLGEGIGSEHGGFACDLRGKAKKSVKHYAGSGEESGKGLALELTRDCRLIRLLTVTRVRQVWPGRSL